ncbi:uncharacterized protein DS421_14g464010 [Arachis hypogaea]|nr:uncharacterized protein DS421_14g464010 [Arachis hypogaea]
MKKRDKKNRTPLQINMLITVGWLLKTERGLNPFVINTSTNNTTTENTIMKSLIKKKKEEKKKEVLALPSSDPYILSLMSSKLHIWIYNTSKVLGLKDYCNCTNYYIV